MARSRTRTLATVLVVLLTVLAGCGGAAQSGGADSGGGGDGGGAGGASDVEAEKRAATAQASTELAAEGDGGSGDASSTQSIDSRALIRTGRIELEVTDFERTERNLTALVESRGGFVSDSQVQQRRVGDQTYLIGQLVLRVPSDRFAATFEEIQREGEVLEASTSTEDVTEQLVDIEARLDNLRAQRDRLRTLYENADDTEAVLQVERRLSEVQTEIERLEARKQSLERRVAFSTITVQIREERPDRLGVDEKWYDIGFVAAFLESVNGVVVAFRAGIVLLGYALPYLLVLATPIGLLGGALAWRRGWRPLDRTAVVDDEPEPTDSRETTDGDGDGNGDVDGDGNGDVDGDGDGDNPGPAPDGDLDDEQRE